MSYVKYFENNQVLLEATSMISHLCDPTSTNEFT